MSKKRRAWRFAIAGIILVAGAAGYEILATYNRIVVGLCGTEIRRTVSSPSSKLSIVVFERDCGATTDFSTQLSVIPAGTSFIPENFPPFFVIGGRRDLVPNWRDEAEIEVILPRGGKVYRNETHVNGIAVTYK